MASDVFPATLNTWIGGELNRGSSGRLKVNQYLMSTYAWPLRVYYLGTNLRWLGEPDDVIGGFFASRLAQGEFFGKWQASGIRLRRWLMNSFSYYLMEMRREHRKQRTAVEAIDEPVTFSGDPNAALDQAAAVAFVRQAMLEAQKVCESDDLGDHWQIFLRHHLEGAPFADLGKEYGVDAARATVMARTATRKFRAALRDVLERDGVAPERIDEEIQMLVKEIGS
ncbi:MAG: hypothetical protein L0Y44_00030 [Phycisphaerales bacterium]|nr:hypothetical protein [Phycisphaerales bacterium]MCI0629025.1 hypothetical protein [Phycisphaerales bacterium]MCI0674782.1 hypothetical protein [Phycisphaerales bacterium]